MSEELVTQLPNNAKVARPGVLIHLPGVDIIVPALTVGIAERMKDRIDKMRTPDKSVSIGERLLLSIPVFGEVIRLNHPEITDDFLKEAVDLRTHKEISAAIWAVSGLELASPAPTQAVSASEKSSGAISSAQ